MFDPATASYLLGLVVAIAGGFFGAAIGGNFAFAITGITVLTSFGIYLGTDSTAGFTYLAFGPFVGPHVAFAGGVGAAAYAGRRGYADSKDATSPLARLGKPDVLWVGAAFGVFGYVVQNLITKIPWFGTHTDSVALTVVLSAVVARLVAKGSFLTPEKYNDSPSFFGKIAPTEDAAWLRYQEKAGQYLSLGAMFGLLAGGATLFIALAFPGLAATGNAQTFTFAVSAVCVMFLILGAQMPVTHHITISAGLAAVAFLPVLADNLVEGLSGTDFWDKLSSNKISLASLFDPNHTSYGMLGENAKGQLMTMAIVALLASVVVGMLAAWLAEFQARLFHNRGNTHFDPPAAAIWIANTIIVSLANIAAPLF